jgi:transcriptional repressor NrdR
VRRRRRCSACGHRFTTFERYERGLLYVRKRGGERQPFDRAKLRGGLARAAHKRPVAAADLDAIADRIEAEAEKAGGELPAPRVGELCLDGLRRLDRVSYLQFAAVYKQLDVDQVRAELARLAREPGPLPEPTLLGDSQPEFAGSGPRSVRLPSDPA